MPTYNVKSMSPARKGVTYHVVVNSDGEGVTCTCPHFSKRAHVTRCKHFAKAEEMHRRAKAAYARAREFARKRVGVEPSAFNSAWRTLSERAGFAAAFRATARINSMLDRKGPKAAQLEVGRFLSEALDK